MISHLCSEQSICLQPSELNYVDQIIIIIKCNDCVGMSDKYPERLLDSHAAVEIRITV